MKKKESLLLRLMWWLHEQLTPQRVGWLWACNSIAVFVFWAKFSHNEVDLLLAIFAFLIALYWWTVKEKG